MRVNDRGGYDVVIRRENDGQYLGGYNEADPQWTTDPDLARSEETDEDMVTTAEAYGLADSDHLINGYALQHIPWANPDVMTDANYYDDDGNVNYDAVRHYVQG